VSAFATTVGSGFELTVTVSFFFSQLLKSKQEDNKAMDKTTFFIELDLKVVFIYF
jgi:hypothetical protein